MAAAHPAGPPPTTATSNRSCVSSSPFSRRSDSTNAVVPSGRWAGTTTPSLCHCVTMPRNPLTPRLQNTDVSASTPGKTWYGRWAGHHPSWDWASTLHARKSACHGTALPAVRSPGACPLALIRKASL